MIGWLSDRVDKRTGWKQAYLRSCFSSSSDTSSYELNVMLKEARPLVLVRRVLEKSPRFARGVRATTSTVACTDDLQTSFMWLWRCERSERTVATISVGQSTCGKRAVVILEEEGHAMKDTKIPTQYNMMEIPTQYNMMKIPTQYNII